MMNEKNGIVISLEEQKQESTLTIFIQGNLALVLCPSPFEVT